MFKSIGGGSNQWPMDWEGAGLVLVYAMVGLSQGQEWWVKRATSDSSGNDMGWRSWMESFEAFA